ncbi:uncharacterized protein TNCV_1307481 [Trichonephila clavipes]|nr:uncharacterized protein TNCV_1307481 [Trichonephila clavipes]
MISEANGWTEGVKACQLAASLKGESAEILQTLPDTERLNLNSLYNALDLWFGQKYSKDYALFRGRHERGRCPEGCVNDVQDLKSALKLEAATQASRRDRKSIRGAKVTLDAPCESPWKSDMEKLRDEFQAFKAQRQNQEKRNFKCWGYGGTGYLRRNCP